ncbi:MAG: BTAD domain-containing putative transcriptional regulator [Dongiaceae bacterium]
MLVELNLLGQFRLRLTGGGDIDLPSHKDRALLAILAAQPGVPQSRDKLAGVLWSDRGDTQARDSLKHALMHVRQSLAKVAPEPIAADRQTITLMPAAFSIDVVRFEDLLRAGTPEALEQAAALYTGDLLDGIAVRNPAFEDWLLAERQRLRRLAEEALTRLLSPALPARTRERAALQLSALDPLRDAPCRALMLIHADRGETAQALKLYEALRNRLHAELGIKPEGETAQLYESIRRRRDTPSPPQPEPSPASRPSIAVLPFENLSGDPEQRYFSDGITEDVITELSRNHGLFVIARNSSFQYRDQASDVNRVGRELGAHYVVEGSIRSMGPRIRIAVQLIDATSGSHLWAERFDRDLEALFDIQDEVVRAIVATISGEIEAAGIEKARRKRTDSLAAYDCFLRGLEHFNRGGSEDTVPGRDFFARAIEIDPGFARAHAFLAWALVEIFWTKMYSDREGAQEALATALQAAQRAVTLDSNDALCHWSLGFVHFARKSLDLAAHHFDLATKLNLNDAEGTARCSVLKVFAGKPEESLRSIARARILNPRQPNYCYDVEGLALYHLRRYEEAIKAFECMTAKQPYIHRYHAAACAQAGRLAEARASAQQSLALQPDFSLRVWSEWEPYAHHADLEHMREGLRKAGLPE